MFDFLKTHGELVSSISFKVLLSAGIGFGCFLLVKLTKTALHKAVGEIKSFDKTFLPVLETISMYAIYIIGGLVILSLYDINVNSIVAVIGAAGLAITLALKDTLSNLACGVLLLMLRPFKNDETIETDKITATVEKIGLFMTKLSMPDGVDVEYPNSLLWANTIKNYSRNKKRRLSISVTISYDQKVESALAVLDRLIAEDTRFLKDPAPRTVVAELANSAVVLQLRAWTKTSDYWEVFWETNKKIKLAAEKGELQLPYPQMDVHLKKD